MIKEPLYMLLNNQILLRRTAVRLNRTVPVSFSGGAVCSIRARNFYTSIEILTFPPNPFVPVIIFR